ncbi:MAG: efflux transporter outer membrane subunit [Rhodothermales bacterium]
MRTPMRYSRFILFSGILTLSACSFTPHVKAPEVVTEMPDTFVHTGNVASDDAGNDAGKNYAPLRWWSSFEDPVLDRLIDSTLTSNLDLVEAVARVAEVRAQYRVERSALFPSLSATANGSFNDQPANSGFGAQFSALGGSGEAGGEGEEVPEAPSAPSRISFENYSAGLNLAYEIDFWGRVKNSSRAALSDYFATESDLQAARLAVINQTIQTYFEVVDLRRRIEFNVETIDVLTERVSRTQERYDRGLITSFELYATLQDYRNTQAGLPSLERQLVDAEGRLAVIIGKYAGHIDEILGDTLSPRFAGQYIPGGLPADLLNQRPDVRAAAERLEAARYRVGARIAERYPTISPSGTLGLQSSGFEDLFDLSQWYVSLAAGITAPLFQGGRLKANVEAAEARYIQQAAGYTRTVLTAFQEAESALAGMEEEQQRFAFLNGQREEAQSAVDLQASRYENGVGEYLDYLDALRTFYNVETNLSGAARDLALARLGVHRALGGGWVEGEINPTLKMVSNPLTGIE